jgi:integrase
LTTKPQLETKKGSVRLLHSIRIDAIEGVQGTLARLLHSSDMQNDADKPLFSYGLADWEAEPAAAFDAFLAGFQFDGRHLRESSFTIYRGMFDRLRRWALEQGKSVLQLDETALEVFLEMRGLSRETRHRYLLVFSTWFAHLAQLRQVQESKNGANPARVLLMEAKAPEREDPEALTPAELQLFVDALPAPTTWKKARTNALVYAILGAGLRSSEALALTLTDLPLKNGLLETVWVQARKPRPERQIPLQPFARQRLQDWLAQRADLGIPGTRVFPANPAGAELQPVTLFRLIQSTLERAGITKRYEGATLLRNTCGALWLEHHDSFKVMQWMGHATQRTTELLLPPEKRTVADD